MEPNPLRTCTQVRGMLANLGYQKLDDIIGRTDLLQPRNVKLRKIQLLDLSFLLKVISLIASMCRILAPFAIAVGSEKLTENFHHLSSNHLVSEYVYFREL